MKEIQICFFFQHLFSIRENGLFYISKRDISFLLSNVTLPASSSCFDREAEGKERRLHNLGASTFLNYVALLHHLVHIRGRLKEERASENEGPRVLGDAEMSQKRERESVYV